MKKEFLEGLDLGEGVKLPKEAITAIMAEHGKDIETHKNTITQLTTERDGLKTQLDTATTEIKSYKDLDVEGVKAKAAEWETKYNTETQTLKDQLAAANYGFSIKEATAGLKFTSESARKAFVADLTAKKLPLQEGKLLGMEDFKKDYQAADPNAFAPEGDDKTPVATKGTGGDTTPAADAALRAAFGLPDNSKKE
ncbi:MAG: phage scaffolding protein [Oscillospiraceae bacterium]